jgi:hypothetical protein
MHLPVLLAIFCLVTGPVVASPAPQLSSLQDDQPSDLSTRSPGVIGIECGFNCVDDCSHCDKETEALKPGCLEECGKGCSQEFVKLLEEQQTHEDTSTIAPARREAAAGMIGSLPLPIWCEQDCSNNLCLECTGLAEGNLQRCEAQCFEDCVQDCENPSANLGLPGHSLTRLRGKRKAKRE